MADAIRRFADDEAHRLQVMRRPRGGWIVIHQPVSWEAVEEAESILLEPDEIHEPAPAREPNAVLLTEPLSLVELLVKIDAELEEQNCRVTREWHIDDRQLLLEFEFDN